MHKQPEDYETVTKSHWYGFAAYVGMNMSYLFINQHEPEKSLWAACLEQAFTLCNTKLNRKAKGQKSDTEADEAWFTSDSREVGSYLFICEVLELDPKVTYREGLKLRERTKLKPRHGRQPGKVVKRIKENVCSDSSARAT